MTRLLILHNASSAYAELLAPVFPDVDIAIVPIEAATTELPSDVTAHLPGADAIVSIGRWLTSDVLAQCRRLRWFQCAISGTDHLADPLSGSGVILTNARGIHGPQMSELTVLHMMAAYRQVPRLVRNQAEHRWDRFKPRVLHGRTVVLLGVGTIAEHVARTCRALGMRTVGVSRTPRQIDGFDRIEPRERLLQTVAEADFLVVLLPLTEENRGAVGADVFGAMKPSAHLINVSRGKVVDEAALIDALLRHKIAGAGLDVFETSPLPADSPFWAMENVFVTPFVGGQSDQYEENLVGIIAENLRAFAGGRADRMVNRIILD